jgi:ribosome-associated protein
LPKKSESGLNTLELEARRIAEIADGAKGESIIALDLRGICDFADAFIIITATSSVHLNAMMMKIEKEIRRDGIRPFSKPDLSSGRWGLIDFSNIIVHLFDSETRNFYNLENLWGDAPRLNLEGLPSVNGGSHNNRVSA